ncbi:LptF/LptG family permease [Candidatus Tisiphia endosymbiont of Beris chalybata]|uniref:LptF/LptG family permease n=1 Tax=Candidatus Tisiphia endosymbiont of Beris chalybata TaxID=3066262 RepID=UPI00312C76DB
MLIYKYYIIKNILPSLITIILSLTALVWITQILKFLYLIDKGIKISHFFNLIILIIPSLLFILLPFATIISTIYTYIHLNERRHLMILQNFGLNNLQIASPALLISFIMMLLTYYISASLLPLSYTKLKADLRSMKHNYTTNILEEKIFTTVAKNITVYFDNKLADGTMRGLIIFDNRKADSHAILFAQSGNLKIYNNASIFQLHNGLRQVHDYNGNLTNLKFTSLTIELGNENQAGLMPNNSNREINEYYIHELLNPPADLPPQRRTKLIAEGHQRLIWPLYNFVLVFLTLSIFLRQPYNKKSHLRQVLITVFFIVIITYLHFVFQNFTAKNLIFIFACYGNVITAIILSIYLYFRRTI